MSTRLLTAVSVGAMLVVPLVVIFFVGDRHTSFLADTLSSFTSSSSSSSSSSSRARHPRARSTNASAAARVPDGCNIFQGEWVPDDSAPLLHQSELPDDRGAPELLQVRPAGPRVPAVAVAAGRVPDAAVRRGGVLGRWPSLARNHMQSLMCLLTKTSPRRGTPGSGRCTTSRTTSPSPSSGPRSSSGRTSPSPAAACGASSSTSPTSPGRPGSPPSTTSSSPRRTGSRGRPSSTRPAASPPATTASSPASRTSRCATLSAWRSAPRCASSPAGGEVQRHRDRADAVADVALRGRGVGHRRRLPADAAVRRQRDADGGAGDLDFHTAQVEEFARAKKAAAARGGSATRLVLMDTTPAMLLRPDGHPSRHGHRPDEKVTLYNDCVHWCLPGPIDVWNEMLFQMLLTD